MADKMQSGDMPRMVPDRDEIRNRSHQPQGERKAHTAQRKPERVQTSAKNSWVLVALVIVIGVGLGFIALQQYSMMQLQSSYEERLVLADERIVNLEKALTQTDESVVFNEAAINAQFKAIKSESDLHMDEIRKLWDVTNKRNKQWIQDNQASLATQEKAMASIEKSLQSLTASQASDEQMFSELQTQLTQEKSNLASLQESFVDVSSMMETTDERITQMNSVIGEIEQANFDERLLTLTINQEDSRAAQARSAKSLSDLQDNMKAVDAGRIETSRRLTALSNQLDTLNAKVLSLTGQ